MELKDSLYVTGALGTPKIILDGIESNNSGFILYTMLYSDNP